jgi:hypothetical protein
MVVEGMKCDRSINACFLFDFFWGGLRRRWSRNVDLCLNLCKSFVCVCVCVFVASEWFSSFVAVLCQRRESFGFEALFENRAFGASQCLNGLLTNSEGPRAL